MADIQHRQAETGVSQVKSVRDYLMKPEMKASLAGACSKHVTPERLLKVACTAMSRNPKLASCTKESLFLSLMTCGQLGLEPLLGRAHLIPRKNGKTGQMECQFQAGFQGLAELARRSGLISELYSEVVYERDQFSRTLGDNPGIVHIPYDGEEDPGALRFAYAVCLFKDATRHRVCLNRREVYKHRDVSTAYQNWKKYGGDCPWVGPWEAEMWKKTAVISLCKLLPLTIELADAMAMDPDAVGDVVDLGAMAADGAIDVPATVLDDAPATTKPETRTSALAGKIGGTTPEQQQQEATSPAPAKEPEKPAGPAPATVTTTPAAAPATPVERRWITIQAMQAAAEAGGWTLDDLTGYYQRKKQLAEGKDWQALSSSVKAQICDNPKLYAPALLAHRTPEEPPTPNPEAYETTEQEIAAGDDQGDQAPFDAPTPVESAQQPAATRRIPATAILSWCARNSVPPTKLTAYLRANDMIPADKDYSAASDDVKAAIIDNPEEYSALVKSFTPAAP